MSEWMEIGETLDYLIKNGGIAENSKHETIEYSISDFSFKARNGETVELNRSVVEYNWRIVPSVPKYITLPQAFKAYHEGKTIVSHWDNEEMEFNKDKPNAWAIYAARFFIGKWTVKD